MGADALLWGTIAGNTVSIRIGPEDAYTIGDTISAAFDPSSASVFDAESGARL
jgi:multiple sugar transport system ATP-binding protein